MCFLIITVLLFKRRNSILLVENVKKEYFLKMDMTRLPKNSIEITTAVKSGSCSLSKEKTQTLKFPQLVWSPGQLFRKNISPDNNILCSVAKRLAHCCEKLILV